MMILTDNWRDLGVRSPSTTEYGLWPEDYIEAISSSRKLLCPKIDQSLYHWRLCCCGQSAHVLVATTFHSTSRMRHVVYQKQSV